MTTVLTEGENDAFDGFAEHYNSKAEFCCPHCLESSKNDDVDRQFCKMKCPSCGQYFVAWVDQEPVYKSAPLPQIIDL